MSTYVLGAQKNHLIERSFEYPQHMFWLRNKKIKFSLRTLNLRPNLQNWAKDWGMKVNAKKVLHACLQNQNKLFLHSQ